MNEQYRKAIQSIESSGGDYSLLGPVTKSGDRAYGAYQVMGANIPEWTTRHLGRAYTPEEFLADTDAQDKVFDAQFGHYVSKYGNPQDAASAWFTGGPLATGANKRDVLGTTGNAYVDKFNKALGGTDGVSAINAAAGIQPSTPGALTSAFAPTEDKGALSTDNVQGPGALYAPADPDRAGVIGRGLTGIGAALAGISSPEQSKSLTAQMVAQQKQPTDAGAWSIHEMKNGQSFLINSKDPRKIIPMGNYGKPEEDTYLKKAKEESAKSNVELGVNISNAAREVADQSATVDELRRTLSDPNLRQGFLGDLGQQARKLYAVFGFGDPDTVANGDVASALSNKLALQLVQNGGVKLLPGSFSDSDRKFVTQMSTSLNNTPEANQRLLDLYTRAHEKVQALDALRAKHEAENNGVIMPSFRKEMADLSKKLLDEDRARAAANPVQTKGSPAAPTLPKGVKSIQLIK